MGWFKYSSWGLSLFVLFEHKKECELSSICSWGLSLFVLFEPTIPVTKSKPCSWGLSLFVLFEPVLNGFFVSAVLED